MRESLTPRLATIPRRDGATAWTLRGLLVARASWNVAFAVYLVGHHEETVASLIIAFVRFSYVDAILALATAGAYLAYCPKRLLWLSPSIDAATRAALVGIVALGPGLVDVPVTAILYLGLLATFAVVDGALDIGEGMSLDRELGHRSGWRSLAVSGTAALVTGVIMFVADPGPDPLRMLLVVLSVAHGAAGLFSARHVATLSA
ncbi:MAG TPA: hypothetical protein VFY85_12905 [Gemmatimonadaceae bacterium]|nr:hypothetical protein [Gemmatimonadaceae bacterium]